MLHPVALLREFHAPFVDLSPGMIGLQCCENLVAHLQTEGPVTKKYCVRHFLGIERALQGGEPDSAYWLPGPENPADGANKVTCDVAHSLRPPQSESFRPQTLRQPSGVAPTGRPSASNDFPTASAVAAFRIPSLIRLTLTPLIRIFCGGQAAGYF